MNWQHNLKQFVRELKATAISQSMITNRLHWHLVGLSVLLMLIVSCGVPAATTITIAPVQPTPIPSLDATYAPTPPRHAPIAIAKVTSSPLPVPAVETPLTANELLLPTPTPAAVSTEVSSSNGAVALQDIGISAAEATADPVATIAAQLEQPINDAAPVDETANLPLAPTSQSPLPVADVASLLAQLPTDLAWDGVPRTLKAPILMYHYLSTPPANADIYRKDLSVSPELFSAQLDRIQAEGYTTINLYDLVAHLLTGAALPEKPLILTFDDGYRDNYENAFPALQAHGMKATFFVVIDFINEQRPEYLTWEMLRAMHNAGMSIEAHGLDHTTLKKRQRDFLVFQALRSFETLQSELGQRSRFISYPAGQYDQNTIEVFKSAGYWAGITTIQGATHSTEQLFELRRVRIRGTTSPDDLAALLATEW